ncbi:hypothetical protein CQW23_15126 [Capsicum baccatum]|uniref:Uncharacterized protein n=1 Tax=Capsicum baccatum TaxID=33114 RepID=A0A2G2WL58_CAPBA|nr:hypothetical protein CQW23_15126 [Capsicum baccatum]
MSGLYVPPRNRKAAVSSFRKMSMKYMMAKLLKGVETTNTGVTEVKNDLSSINQLVDTHSTAIKQLEQQLSQLSVVVDDIAENVTDTDCDDAVEAEEKVNDTTPRRH